MSSVRFLGFSHGDKQVHFGGGPKNDTVIKHPILVPLPAQEARFGQNLQGAGQPLLTFAGSRVSISPSLRIEHDFIRSLSESKDPLEKAGIAEMLGRARSINAMPHLLKLLSPQEDVKVRIATIGALAKIGGGTDKNSFTRSTLSEALIKFYEERKGEAAQRFSDPLPFQLGKKQEETAQREALLTELKTLVSAISELNASKGRTTLQQDYHSSLNATEKAALISQEMHRIIRMGQEKLANTLEEQYKKPIDEILEEISPKELNELRDGITVTVADGEEIGLLEVMAGLDHLESQQVFASQLLIGIMEGLAKQDDSETTAALKLGLESSHPEVKAKSLRILSQRGGVSYNNDIYPNLKAENLEVRQAALDALLHCKELPAKQKVLELTNPQAYFQAAGTELSLDTLDQYVGFLGKIAEHGDEYVQSLGKTAINSDYDADTRQIALLVLNMMTEEPASRLVSPSTTRQAKSVIRTLAKDPIARTPEEQDALALMATQLWVGQKEPSAIASAILLADSKYHHVSTEDQENLLGSVLAVLQEDADRNGSLRVARLQHRILDVLKKTKSPLLSDEKEKKLREELKPDPAISQIDPTVTPETFAKKQFSLVVNNSLIDALQPAVEPLRPALTSLLDSNKSLPSQMMATRIIGLLRDKVMVERLIDKTRDPLKGRMNWKLERSYSGNPSIDGANIRLNALISLGDIGDAKALDVMMDAVDDPVLKEYVVEPFGKLAQDANRNADETTLKKARGQLMKLIDNPDVSRAQRAVRLQAASALYQFNGGVDSLKDFAAKTGNPNFRRHVLSALVSNGYALDPKHPDHHLVKALLEPELGVSRLHAKGITGKGVEMAVVDGGYVDKTNTEAFGDRVRLPAEAVSPEHYHPTMVASTAAANGKIKGVAPDALIYSDKWPDFEGGDPMEVYKKIIEGKLRGENNVRVINNSWGFSNQNVLIFKEIRDILSQFKQVVDMAEKAGIQIVFAAGNEGEAPGIPKIGTLSLFGIDVDKLTGDEKKTLDYILDRVILVGASNTEGTEDRSQHKMAEFSSVGDSLNRKLLPTVVAPGVDMMVYGWDEASTYPKELVNGTSFASPYASAVIGLMTQVNPKITPAQIREILTSTAVKLKDIPESIQGRHGEIDPEAAVNAAKQLTARKGSKSQTAAEPKPPEAKAEPAKPETPAKQDGDSAA